MPETMEIHTNRMEGEIKPGESICIVSHVHLDQTLDENKEPFEASELTPENIIRFFDPIARELLSQGTRLVIGLTVHGWDLQALLRFQKVFDEYYKDKGTPPFFVIPIVEVYVVPETWRGQNLRATISNVINHFAAQHFFLVLPSLSVISKITPDMQKMMSGFNTISELKEIKETLGCLTMIPHPAYDHTFPFPGSFSFKDILRLQSLIGIEGIELNVNRVPRYPRYPEDVVALGGKLGIGVVVGTDAHAIAHMAEPTDSHSIQIFNHLEGVHLPFAGATYVRSYAGPQGSPFNALKYLLAHKQEDLHSTCYRLAKSIPIAHLDWMRGALTFYFGLMLQGERNRFDISNHISNNFFPKIV
jgi:hypothetical protein